MQAVPSHQDLTRRVNELASTLKGLETGLNYAKSEVKTAEEDAVRDEV
jgi:outer membrane murein-binding lipoprotein Lpp